MRRFTLVALSLLLVVVSFGFRGEYWRGARTIAGDYTFTGNITFSGTKLSIGYDYFQNDTLFFTDGGEDTSYLINDGSYFSFGGDNYLYIQNSGYTVNWYPYADTIPKVGMAAARYKELWGLRHMGTDGAGADSFTISDNGTYTIINTDNAAYFTNPLTGTDSMLNGETQDTIVNTVFGTAAHITITVLETWGSATEWWITTTQDTVFVNVDANPAATISYKWVLVKP